MKIVSTAAELAALPRGEKRAVVMTMGALHEGHLALVRAARAAADQVVVTIFVNPLQFNDPADLERYPRTLEADCALLEPLGVDVVYAPGLEDVYPGGQPVVTVNAGSIGSVFEGHFRPGHFDGVLTVVLKLMNLTRPDLAFFGQKDAQQVMAIRAMVRDLNVPCGIEVVPTVRDADGLALSSRNVFLTPEQRSQALALSRSMKAGEQVLAEGGPASLAVAVARAELATAPLVEVEYVAAIDPRDATAVPEGYAGELVLAVAARVGSTRLIDCAPAVARTPGA